MALLLWLGAGIAAGIFAKAIIPQLDKDNWIFGLLIAIIGSMAGGFAASLSGMGQGLVVNVIVAFAGAVFVLFFYRQYLGEIVNKTA